MIHKRNSILHALKNNVALKNTIDSEKTSLFELGLLNLQIQNVFVRFIPIVRIITFKNKYKNNDILNDCILNVQNWNAMRFGNANLS